MIYLTICPSTEVRFVTANILFIYLFIYSFIFKFFLQKTANDVDTKQF